MKSNEFKDLTKNFHLKVIEKLRGKNWAVPVQVIPSGQLDVQRILVGNEVYDVYNDGNLAQWKFMGNY